MKLLCREMKISVVDASSALREISFRTRPTQHTVRTRAAVTSKSFARTRITLRMQPWHSSRSLERKRGAAAFWPLIRNAVASMRLQARCGCRRSTRPPRGLHDAVAAHESVGAPRSRLERVPTAATANLNSPSRPRRHQQQPCSSSRPSPSPPPRPRSSRPPRRRPRPSSTSRRSRTRRRLSSPTVSRATRSRASRTRASTSTRWASPSARRRQKWSSTARPSSSTAASRCSRSRACSSLKSGIPCCMRRRTCPPSSRSKGRCNSPRS